MRSCGGCTLCCWTHEIPELGKPIRQWCSHCEIGNGCGIYSDRPKSCRDFTCVWLDREEVPEGARPDRSHVVIDYTDDGSSPVFHCQKGYEDAWRRGETSELVLAMMKNGRKAYVMIDGHMEQIRTVTAWPASH